MPSIKTEITGDNSLLAQFTLQHLATGAKQIVENVKSANFDTEAGTKYVLIVEVIGNNGEKYKLKIAGAGNATYYTGEVTMSGGRDFITASITG